MVYFGLSSFEHDFVEVNGEGHASSEKAMSPNKEDVVWNAKVSCVTDSLIIHVLFANSFSAPLNGHIK